MSDLVKDERMKVYLATAGEYSDYRVVRVFARKEDAEAYELANDVEEYELTEGPIEVRRWHTLGWCPWIPDREATGMAAANPFWGNEMRDYDDQPRNVIHKWQDDRFGRRLAVEGWDLDRIRKVYSEQRAQFIARQDMGVENA